MIREHQQRVQELLVNKMERSEEVGIGNEVPGDAGNSKGEMSKEKINLVVNVITTFISTNCIVQLFSK